MAADQANDHLLKRILLIIHTFTVLCDIIEIKQLFEVSS